MKSLRKMVITFVAVLACFQGYSSAATRIVGTCLRGSQYSTIQSAIQASSQGDTVKICPATYFEQVTVTIPLKLTGVTSGSSQVVVIAAPSSALSGPLAAQLLVQNTTGVSISDLVVDGTGVVCTDSVYGVGLYQASATISNSVIRNVTGSGTDACPGRAVGAFNSSSLVFKNNVIHDCWQGVSTSYSTATISGNTISTNRITINVGITTGTLSISNNTIQSGVGFESGGSGAQAIGVYQAPAAISNNTIVMPPSVMAIGIDVEESQNASVTGNKLTGAWSGISLTDSTASTVIGNTVNTSGYVALKVSEVNAGGNTVKGNVVDESPCGLSLSGAKGDTLSPNTYHNTTSTTCD